jgi:hypothetical protein
MQSFNRTLQVFVIRDIAMAQGKQLDFVAGMTARASSRTHHYYP